MNSIIMTTYVAGTILSQATFSTMNDCANARQSVMDVNKSDNIEVTCTYHNNKTSNNDQRFENMLDRFFAMVKQLNEFNKQETLCSKEWNWNDTVVTPGSDSPVYEPSTEWNFLSEFSKECVRQLKN
jgi:hypothetical protein